MRVLILAGQSAWRVGTSALSQLPCTAIFDGLCKSYSIGDASIYVINSTQSTKTSSELAFSLMTLIESLADVKSIQLIASSVYMSNGIKSWPSTSTSNYQKLTEDTDLNNQFLAVLMKLSAFSSISFSATIHPEKREKISEMLVHPDTQSLKVLMPIAELLSVSTGQPIDAAFVVSKEAIEALESIQKKEVENEDCATTESASPFLEMYI